MGPIKECSILPAFIYVPGRKMLFLENDAYFLREYYCQDGVRSLTVLFVIKAELSFIGCSLYKNSRLQPQKQRSHRKSQQGH